MSNTFPAPASAPAASPPPVTLALLEPYRAAAELASLWLSAPLFMCAPRGDGHTVLVLPGFNADDHSTACLRGLLNYLGYNCSEWGLGTNMGYRTLGESERRLRRRVQSLAQQSGRRISLVGWSLGGVMARHMARDHPELIRRVITLGAPFTGDPRATTVRFLYELASGDDLDSVASQRAWRANQATPKVPTTSIFSKSDGITAWQNCLEVETENTENIEVVGSHMGLPHIPMALCTLVDRLARPEDRSNDGARPI